VSSRLTLVAVAIPVLGMLAVIGRAELASRDGIEWTIPIEGFDPRDPLHGQYLEYRYRFRWTGPHTCGPQLPGEELGPDVASGCCLCLSARDGRVDPEVRQVQCAPDPSCDALLNADAVRGRQRYFIPEDRAEELERALRERPAALRLRVAQDASPVVGELLLGDRPWREALGE
jgi:hypothetical protein